MIALLSALSLSTYAQSDTCYTREQNRRIAEKLIEGDNWKKAYNEQVQINELQSKAIDIATGISGSQQVAIAQLNDEKQKLQKKIKRRNRWIVVLTLLNIGQAIG